MRPEISFSLRLQVLLDDFANGVKQQLVPFLDAGGRGILDHQLDIGYAGAAAAIPTEEGDRKGASLLWRQSMHALRFRFLGRWW